MLAVSCFRDLPRRILATCCLTASCGVLRKNEVATLTGFELRLFNSEELDINFEKWAKTQKKPKLYVFVRILKR